MFFQWKVCNLCKINKIETKEKKFNIIYNKLVVKI
jgi:hypothetical protein